MRRRILFFTITAGLFVAAIANAQYPKSVQVAPLVMNGVPVKELLAIRTVSFPKFVTIDPFMMTGVIPKTAAIPFTTKFVTTEPLFMTGISIKTGVK